MSDSDRFGFTFTYLRDRNVKRCISKEGFNHPLASWDVMQWGCATSGEIGEACNIAKKLGRYDIGNQRVNKSGETERALLLSLADEVADGVIYADLWLASQGLDLGSAIITKFNRTSASIGADIFL